MIVDGVRLLTVCRKVKALKEHRELYCLDPKRIPVSINDLKYIIEDMYGLNIGWNEVLFSAEMIRSVVERYNNHHALIYVRSGLADDLKRFSVTKELMHIVIDEEEDWSVDGVDTLTSFFTEISIKGENGGSVAERRAQSELLAEFAAVEVLYPHEFREQDRKDILAGLTTIEKLALHYNIPPFAVQHGLGQFGQVAARMWKKIEAEAH